ncbi:MAG TPA: NAD-dependent epimerase/dehydratase family protein, partial [Thermoplasmatales archaeon]|nr:NAD-dependent epimerase/dehydratase family protein [Thermoplasmatales archaeon]
MDKSGSIPLYHLRRLPDHGRHIHDSEIHNSLQGRIKVYKFLRHSLKMRIAITGAAGYFGRKIIERLHERDDVEYIFGISRREFRHSYEKLEYRRMDVRESELKKIFKEKEIDAVIHLAFVLNPIHNEREMHDININGARNVLEAAEHAGVEKIIMTSSTMVYGAWPDNP